MIDVTFLLIVFFVLVSQIVEVENVEMQLPELPDPASDTPGEEQRVVINIKPALDSSEALEYTIGSTVFPPGEQSVPALAQHLADLYTNNPNLSVNLRADTYTHYTWIEPVFRAIAQGAALAGDDTAAARVNLVIIPED